MAYGVYKEWIEGKGLEMVCKWAKLGMTDQQIIKKMGIKERTFYAWQKRFPNFHKSLKEAKTIPNLEIETTMIDLACGRVFVEEIKSTIDPKSGAITKIEKIRKQVPPNPVLLIFLAKNRMRDKYKDYSPVPAENSLQGEEVQAVQIYLPDKGDKGNDT